MSVGVGDDGCRCRAAALCSSFTTIVPPSYHPMPPSYHPRATLVTYRHLYQRFLPRPIITPRESLAERYPQPRSVSPPRARTKSAARAAQRK